MKILWWRRRRQDLEIAPEEIFLDASNTSFDTERFEGRLEKPLSQSAFVSFGAALAVIFIMLIVRAWNLQIVNGEEFAIEGLGVGVIRAGRSL